MLNAVKPDREYITTPQAAERSSLSKNYIATLLRRGKLDGFQLARAHQLVTKRQTATEEIASSFGGIEERRRTVPALPPRRGNGGGAHKSNSDTK